MNPRPPPTVWIVDDDLGFVWWLGEIFTEAGCRALPALNSEHAVSLMKKLKVAIDVVVVNPELTGVDRMLRSLQRANRRLKVITIAATALTDASTPEHAILVRPTAFEAISRPKWLEKVRKLLREMKTATTV